MQDGSSNSIKRILLIFYIKKLTNGLTLLTKYHNEDFKILIYKFNQNMKNLKALYSIKEIVNFTT